MLIQGRLPVAHIVPRMGGLPQPRFGLKWRRTFDPDDPYFHKRGDRFLNAGFRFSLPALLVMACLAVNDTVNRQIAAVQNELARFPGCAHVARNLYLERQRLQEPFLLFTNRLFNGKLDALIARERGQQVGSADCTTSLLPPPKPPRVVPRYRG